MYMNTLLHCHFCIQIITDHFLLIKVSHSIHTIPGINAHLLYPILCSWKYSITHKLLYCPVCIFGCFHGNQRCVASCHYFYTWGVLQEVDIISMVRPYKDTLNLCTCEELRTVLFRPIHAKLGGDLCLFVQETERRKDMQVYKGQ